MKLEGKIALVTGGSRGIGRAVCRLLASEGAFVFVNYSSSEDAARETLEEVKGSGGDGEIVRFNVADEAEVRDAVEKIVKEKGRLDILVNNAGIAIDNLIVRLKGDDFDRVVSVNLKGVFNCSRAVARQMMKQKYGRIINVTSVVGEMGNAGQSVYSASKAGIIGFTKSLAKELASRGVTVNAVSPGFIETDMTASLPEKVREEYLASIPLGRFGEPEDVARAVLFLASDGASYITGEVIRVNGGLYM
ncbi:MAG: 3-oxoacyl-[acyl-carrier-protein] reductase [Deltaproteobacteria bacterium]|nr:MAG: 3-oxoacyl-[acyl-carrier-protein] reductase [Deltaproteobacteria bacterium]